jgi:hypothetical protein
MARLNVRRIDSGTFTDQFGVYAGVDGVATFLPSLRSISEDLFLHISPSGNDESGDGSSLKPWATPHKAFDWLHDRTIAAGKNVTILLADGDYYFSETLKVDHPFGSQIQIIGNESDGIDYNAFFIEQDKDSGVIYIVLDGDQTANFPSTSYLKIMGDTENFGVYAVDHSEFVNDGVWPRTKIFIVGDLPNTMHPSFSSSSSSSSYFSSSSSSSDSMSSSSSSSSRWGNFHRVYEFCDPFEWSPNFVKVNEENAKSIGVVDCWLRIEAERGYLAPHIDTAPSVELQWTQEGNFDASV